IALSVAVMGGLGLYLRFGFVWAALGSMCCLAALPFQFHVSTEASRAEAAVLIGLVFVLTRVRRLRHGEAWPGDEYGVLQAAARAGVYVLLNLRLLPWWDYYRPIVRPAEVHGWFYWLTWVFTWILPAVGLVLGVRGKDRPLLMVSVVMAILTLVTNKPYL